MKKPYSDVQLWPYRTEDGESLAALFYDTVHHIHAGDYTWEQLDAWATGRVDLEEWDRRFLRHNSVVAWLAGSR